jgi:CheY-like chemotaxis protein
VVDDSRVALVSLSRRLKEHGLTVDTAESGVEAIDYLRMNLHPSVIFLDHMMPGMDGFDTLRALKSEPRTCTVPVVMYTSTEGESYIGQALALGAIDVLRKPIDPAELMQILQRLKTGSEYDVPRRATLSTQAPATREETAQSFVAVPDDTEQATTATDTPPAQTPPSPTRLWLKRGLYTALLLLPVVWYGRHYYQAEALRAEAQNEIARLKSEVQHAASVDAAGPLRDTLAAQQRMLRVRTRALSSVLAWALNLHGQYDYDQLPLGDERLLLLRELMARLDAAEFQGVVRLETYVGEFCLVRDEQGVYHLPARNLPFSRCEVVNHSSEYATLLGQRQSTEFARFLAEASPNIQVEIISRGNSRPLAPYPDRSSVQTAGEWNQIARQNNRVDISIIPTP